MKGFALILAFLVVEAAFLWHAAAPRAMAPRRAWQVAPSSAFRDGAPDVRAPQRPGGRAPASTDGEDRRSLARATGCAEGAGSTGSSEIVAGVSL